MQLAHPNFFFLALPPACHNTSMDNSHEENKTIMNIRLCPLLQLRSCVSHRRSSFQSLNRQSRLSNRLILHSLKFYHFVLARIILIKNKKIKIKDLNHNKLASSAPMQDPNDNQVISTLHNMIPFSVLVLHGFFLKPYCRKLLCICLNLMAELCDLRLEVRSRLDCGQEVL